MDGHEQHDKETKCKAWLIDNKYGFGVVPQVGDRPGTWLEMLDGEHCPICDIEQYIFDEVNRVMLYTHDQRVLDYEDTMLVDAYIETAILLKRLGHG